MNGVSTVFPDDRASDEKPEADPASAGVTSAADPADGLEHLPPLAPRHPGPPPSTRIATRPASGASVPSASPPCLTALSTRLEIARRMAVGRQDIVTSRGPEKAALSPAST